MSFRPQTRSVWTVGWMVMCQSLLKKSNCILHCYDALSLVDQVRLTLQWLLTSQSLVFYVSGLTTKAVRFNYQQAWLLPGGIQAGSYLIINAFPIMVSFMLLVLNINAHRHWLWQSCLISVLFSFTQSFSSNTQLATWENIFFFSVYTI